MPLVRFIGRWVDTEENWPPKGVVVVGKQLFTTSYPPELPNEFRMARDENTLYGCTCVERGEWVRIRRALWYNARPYLDPTCITEEPT